MKNNKGFTLIELIVSFGIISALITGTTLMLTTVVRGTAKAAAIAKVRNEGEYLMETMSQRVRYAEGVICTDGTDDIMTVTAIDGSTSIFYCDAGNESIDRDAKGASTALNTGQVDVTLCQFICTPSSPSTASNVEIIFSVQDIDGLSSPLSFDTNIVLRNR